jgi:hypothetical protein
VADCYAMLSAANPYQAARAEIERRSGSQLDPTVVAAFCSLPSRVWQEISDAVQQERDEAVA